VINNGDMISYVVVNSKDPLLCNRMELTSDNIDYDHIIRKLKPIDKISKNKLQREVYHHKYPLHEPIKTILMLRADNRPISDLIYFIRSSAILCGNEY
jgi:hypothetical protein